MPMRSELVLFDADFSVVFVSKIPAPLTEDNVIGKPPWNDEYCIRRDQAAWKRGCADAMKRGSLTLDLHTKQSGTWRHWLMRCDVEGAALASITRRIPAGVEHLSSADWELLGFILEGKSNKQLAKEWRISEPSASNRRKRLARKLGLPLRDLAGFALTHRLWLE